MEQNVSIGIDPGKTGGLVIMCIHSMAIEAYRLESLTDGDVVDALDYQWIGATAWLEDPRGVMPGMRTPKSISGPAESFGFLRGVLAALNIRREIVRPKEWQKVFKLPTRKAAGSDTAKKRAHRQRAQELFPDVKVTNWNADSLLIAEFGRRQMLNERGAT